MAIHTVVSVLDICTVVFGSGLLLCSEQYLVVSVASLCWDWEGGGRTGRRDNGDGGMGWSDR